MPIYEYRCRACGHEFDKLQRMNAEAPPCSACGEPQTERKVSLSSFRLKGSGWYKTDYASSSSGGSTDGAGTGGDGGSGASSEVGGGESSSASSSESPGSSDG